MKWKTLALLAALTGACDSSDVPAAMDASSGDLGSDAAGDLGVDAAVDAPRDAGSDVLRDAPRSDVREDVGVADVGVADVGVADVGVADVGVDVPTEDGAAFSDEGGACGGFVLHPPQCASELVCVSAMIPDLPGVCRRRCPTGTGCAAGTTCTDGACVPARPCIFACAIGRQNCGTDCCVSLQTDPHHCGSCETACAAGQSCVAGACSP